MWLVDKRWKDIVWSHWHTELQGSASYIHSQKLYVSGQALRKWHGQTFGNIEKRMTTIEGRLNSIQAELIDQDGVVEDKIQCEQQLMDEYSKLLQMKHIKWA